MDNGCFILKYIIIIIFVLFHQKSSTRHSDPNLPNLPDIGIYDEVSKLAGLDVNGQYFSVCDVYTCIHVSRIALVSGIKKSSIIWVSVNEKVKSMCGLSIRWISLW